MSRWLGDFRRCFNLGGRKKAVILGKGPSYEKVHGLGLSDYPPSEYFWVGINQACLNPRAEALIASHVEPVGESVRGGFSGPVITPVYPLYGWNSSHDKQFQEHGEYGDLNVYSYVPYWCADRVPTPKPVQSFGTTAHHIVQMLAEMGVKDFTFFGIDGGRKAYGKKYYADGFEHDSKEYFEQGKIPADFDKFWEFYFQLRRKYGLRYEFI